ncbi:MAG TPA: hypothetical protein VGV89_03290 [Thermoplasmata archaeon]|nr:hypothetical protein [Thermoplasmata archaeon]
MDFWSELTLALVPIALLVDILVGGAALLHRFRKRRETEHFVPLWRISSPATNSEKPNEKAAEHYGYEYHLNTLMLVLLIQVLFGFIAGMVALYTALTHGVTVDTIRVWLVVVALAFQPPFFYIAIRMRRLNRSMERFIGSTLEDSS